MTQGQHQGIFIGGASLRVNADCRVCKGVDLLKTHQFWPIRKLHFG